MTKFNYETHFIKIAEVKTVENREYFDIHHKKGINFRNGWQTSHLYNNYGRITYREVWLKNSKISLNFKKNLLYHK